MQDWVREAAEEIQHQELTRYENESMLMVPREIIEIIEKHCPFKKDVTYEEVGEVSRKLDELIALCRTIKRSI